MRTSDPARTLELVESASIRRRRTNRWRPPTIDLVLGVAFAIASVINLYYLATDGRLDDGVAEPDALAYALAVVQALPVMWRRTAPIALAAISTTGFVVARLAEYPVGIEIVALSVAMYAIAMESDRSTAPKIAWPFIVGITGFTTLGVVTDPMLDPIIVGLMFVSLLLPYLLGRDSHERRARAEARELRAAEIEANQEALREAAIREERTRIARELHDVVAHNMTVMTIQAAAARRVLSTDPGKAADALEAIEEAGHGALVEMRRMLGVLRTDDEHGTAAPQPGLARLDALVEEMREAGLAVDIVVSGAACDLSPGIDLNAYRIIQESLTNALRHGGPNTAAKVALTYSDDDLTIEVSDDGRGAYRPGGSNGSGQGLLGMQERAALLHGSLVAGPRAGGGYRVTSTLPINSR